MTDLIHVLKGNRVEILESLTREHNQKIAFFFVLTTIFISAVSTWGTFDTKKRKVPTWRRVTFIIAIIFTLGLVTFSFALLRKDCI